VDPAVIVTLVISVAGVIFASITAPLILAHRTERMHREDMLSDYQRQDAVAKAAKEASDVAHKVGMATVTKLDKANVKLDVIHGLVNSTLSAALQSELDALTTSLAMMREVVALKTHPGQEPAAEALIAIDDTEAKIAELRATLADRLQQAESIASRAALAAAAMTAATREAQDAAVES